jgi:hypothetical protein
MFLKPPVPGSSWTTVVDIEKAGNEHASLLIGQMADRIWQLRELLGI